MESLVESHVHGVREFDFSDIHPEDLWYINQRAEQENVLMVPTVFPSEPQLPLFVDLLREFNSNREALRNIIGFALEGPLLTSIGGTPKRCAWQPTKDQWRVLVENQASGLLYVVISPDFDLNPNAGREYNGGRTLEWLTDLFVLNGVGIAVGHFSRSNPEISASRLMRLVERVEGLGQIATRSGLFCDHLFNDMPGNIRHAWRGASEQSRRADEVRQLIEMKWADNSLEREVGAVPGALLRLAREGRLTPFLNFDGEHVDLELCKKVVEFVGPGRIIGITDHIDFNEMAGEQLTKLAGTSLKVTRDGKVAAGSKSAFDQTRGMIAAGFSEADCIECFRTTPLSAFGIDRPDIPGGPTT